MLTASNVSTNASPMNQAFDKAVVMVALSLSTNTAADMAANGPLTNTITATCGTYVKRNMVAVTPTLRPMIGRSCCTRGDHNER